MTCCIVAPARITDCLLDLNHPAGASEAEFFIATGFSPDNPEQLMAAPKAHLRESPPTSENPDKLGGVRVPIDAPMLVPDGRRPLVRSLCNMDRAEATPRPIIAHPIDRRRHCACARRAPARL